jgi:type I restriction enzyme M protein
MTRKTGNESASKEATSVMPTLLNKASTTAKVTPMATSLARKKPAFLYTQNMLTAEVRTNIDKSWEACWPTNSLRPLVLLDLISYLLFIKKLEENKLIPGKQLETFGDIPVNKIDYGELSWKMLKDLDPQSLHRLFTKEVGIPDLMKSYGNSNRMYSIFVKEPLLLTPTARLLCNMVDIIKLMESEDEGVRALIFEYLINKAEVVAQNGQVYAPDYIVKLMVAMMQPASEDVIGDPSAGNGSFLVNSAMYIADKNSAAFSNLQNDAIANIYKGIECDLVQLRIGAMNMILHGIEDPKLEGLNVFSKTNLSLREQPTLILSNLFFESVEDKKAPVDPPAEQGEQAESRRPEIRLLNLIVKNLQRGGRAAVICRENILYDNGAEIKTIRRHIIDDQKLEAVISLPGKAGSLFSNPCIIVFTKPQLGTTNKVWFYKMEPKNKGAVKKDSAEYLDENDEATDILARWKNEKEESDRSRTERSFYVPIDEIKNNNYNLSFYEYRKIGQESIYALPETSVNGKKSVPAEEIQKQVEAYAIESSEPPVRAGKKYLRLFGSLLVIGITVASLYFVFSKNKSIDPVSPSVPAKITAAAPQVKQLPPVNKVIKKSAETGMLSQDQIKAILKDTAGILHFQNQQGDLAVKTKEAKKPAVKFNNVAVLVNKVNDKPAPVAAPVEDLNIRYAVVDTTYFHDQPDEVTKRKSFLDPLNKNILTPIHDQNGYIFIVYTNHFGITSKGWINKKDLKPLR